MATKTIEVKGMSCNHCVQAVTKALSGLKGVSHVRVDLLGGTASYEEASPVPESEVKAAIERVGFTAGNFR